MNTSELSNLIDSKEKELQEALNSFYPVEEAILNIQKQIIELQGKKKDLEIAKSKANHTIRQLNSELKILRNQFFKARNEGL